MHTRKADMANEATKRSGIIPESREGLPVDGIPVNMKQSHSVCEFLQQQRASSTTWNSEVDIGEDGDSLEQQNQADNKE